VLDGERTGKTGRACPERREGTGRTGKTGKTGRRSTGSKAVRNRFNLCFALSPVLTHVALEVIFEVEG
jgi:hypothetical protein